MAQRDENFSVFVRKTLNAIGYKWETVQQRRHFFKQSEQMLNSGIMSYTGLSIVWAGSKREGVITPLGGDTDIMNVFDEIISAENVRLFKNQAPMTILETDVNECPPGYTLLTPKKHGGRWVTGLLDHDAAQSTLQSLIDSSCVSVSGRSYLSSEKFIGTLEEMSQLGINVQKNCNPDAVFPNVTTFQPRAGPSIPIVRAMNDSFDNVYSLACHCPSVFERFRSRRRKHDWPPQHILQELSQLEAHVVPVGHKRSACHFLEWRICFTKAEIRLIECLTEPQIHVFVLLKIFAKDVLKAVWDAMTSYIMKNLVLWMAELMPTHMFRPDTIVDRFLDCLFFLKLCIKVGKLPNYMITERNLFSHDQFIVKRPKLLSVIDDCIGEKGSCLFRSNTLNDAMVKMHRAPGMTMTYGVERDKTEKSVLSSWIRVGPELSMADSPQDFMGFALSGYASEFLQLLMERIDLDELKRDPVNAYRRVVEMAFSHLR